MKTLTWTFTFLEGIFAISSELSHFSLLGGTSSILRTFLGGTSQKNHPVHWVAMSILQSFGLSPRIHFNNVHRQSHLTNVSLSPVLAARFWASAECTLFTCSHFLPLGNNKVCTFYILTLFTLFTFQHRQSVYFLHIQKADKS